MAEPTVSITGTARFLLNRTVQKVLSVPILIKMMGMGALVAVCFGVITFVRTRDTLRGNLSAVLADRTISETESLAVYLAHPISVNDIVAVKQILENARAQHHDILYIIIRDTQGQIVTHTFDGDLPSELVPMPSYASFPDRAFRVIDGKDAGLIFEAIRPIQRGFGGFVQLGRNNQMVVEQLASLRYAILTSLILCAIVGIVLALVLSLAITHPVHRLAEAVAEIRKYNLNARAPVFYGDEIGNLASAFNDLAVMLQRKDETIRRKEKDRVALVERVISSQENERRLIARELHDQLGQSLLALLVDMRAQREGSDYPALRTSHEGQVEELIKEVRQVSKVMHPSILDDYGLESALRSYTEEISVRHQVDIAYESNCADSTSLLPEAIEIAFYRITQEAVTNALRHAESKQISVVLVVTIDSATLLIEDDGVGFEIDQPTGDIGLGLISMRERVSLLGGKLEIVSTHGEGTIVRARVPLNVAEEYQI